MPWFIPTPWNVGDKITKTRLDRIEQGVADADVRNPDSPAAAALGATYLTGRLVSTDGTNGFPQPTGQGFEVVFAAGGLDDFRLNGVSQ